MGNINGILSSDDVKYRDKLQDNGRIYMAEIMDTRTPLRNGDLKVWIIKTNSDKTNPKNWITAKCVSPMFGCTANKGSLNTDENISFGWWNPMPYVGNYVFVFFPNVYGDNSACYWFGSPMDVSNCMLPGISYDLTTENNTDYKPVCDKNYLKKKDNDRNETNKNKNTNNPSSELTNSAISKELIDKAVSSGLSMGLTAATGGVLPPMVTNAIVSNVTKSIQENMNNSNKKTSNSSNSTDLLNTATNSLSSGSIPFDMNAIENSLKGALNNLGSNELDANTISNTIMQTLNKETNKPKEYKVLSEALKKQGLDKDRLRGISTASSFRETPSHCYGFLSPMGNQFVIDDGWVSDGEKKSWIEDSKKETKNDAEMHKGKDDYGYEHINKEWKAELKESSKGDKLNRFHGGFRFRTRNGTQLLILDCGTIYMINKDGSAWMELSDDGYIDCYSKKGISASSEGDINLHSDKNINIDCTGKLNISAKQGIIMETPAQINANCGTFNVSKNISTENISSNTGNINSLKSSNAEMNGMFKGTLQGTAYFATYSGITPIPQPEPNVDQEIIPPTAKIKKNKTNGSESTVSRKPRHEPWKEHDKNDCIPELNSLSKPKNKNEETKNNASDSKQMENDVKSGNINK